MHPKTVLSILSIIFLLTSCSKKNEEAKATMYIDGTWHLHNVSGGFAGINEFYNEGEIVWEIDAEMISIQNADSIASSGILFENGIYNYSLLSADSLGGKVIYIDSSLIGNYTFDDTNFYISQLYVDGFLYHFKR